LATCRAVVFPPLQEDYGFVTVEAFASRRPVITCADSGGPAELVEDGLSGFVCQPTPESIAAAMRRLADDPSLAERMGHAAFAAGSRLTWPETVLKLVVQ
jgi:glycosyltransferase involved in cell wall biosynthesis